MRRWDGLVTDTNLSAQIDVLGIASENVSATSHWGQLWVSNKVVVAPAVSGTNFWVYDFSMNLGTQNVTAAIRDDAGNTTFVTNTVFLSIITNSVYSYNTNGCVTNLSYAGTQYSNNISLTWNSQYQLTAVSTNGGAAERNGYDAYGRRAWTWDSSCGTGSSSTNYFIYDKANLLAEMNSTGGLKRAYVYAGLDFPLAMTVYTGTTAITYFYLTDKMGTVHAVADESGNVIERYRMDAWGRVLGVYDGQGNPIGKTKIGNRLLFQGREYSWETGFYYFRNRWSDPSVGRWLSPDPIGISGGLNQYVFCGDNPVNFIDPFGLDMWYSSGGGSHAYLIIDDPSSPTGKMIYQTAPAAWGRVGLSEIHGPSQTIFEPYYGGTSRYTHISTTTQQDECARATAQAAAKAQRPYDVLFNNCADTVRAVLKGAGLDVGNRLFDTPNKLQKDINKLLK